MEIPKWEDSEPVSDVPSWDDSEPVTKPTKQPTYPDINKDIAGATIKAPKLAEFTPSQMKEPYRTEIRKFTKGPSEAMRMPESTRTAAARGVKHGLTGLAETVGVGLQFAGAQELGKDVAGYWEKKAKEFEPSKDMQGEVLKDPSLLKNPNWWAYNLADMSPSFAAAIIPGVGAQKYIQIGGKALKFTPPVMKWLTKLGAPVISGLAGGSLEGSHTFKAAKQIALSSGLSEEEAISQARKSAAMMIAASAGLNAISFGKMMNGKIGPGKAMKQILGSALTEAGTEWAEEPSEAAILERMKSDPNWKNIVDATVQGFNVVPLSFVMGGGGSVMALAGQPTIAPPTEKADTEAPAAPAEPVVQPRPEPGSFEAKVLEFKVKQAIGLKPSDSLSQEQMQLAYDAGALPQELAEQVGVPTAIQFADAKRAETIAKQQEAQQEEARAIEGSDDVIEQVLAEKGATPGEQAIGADRAEVLKTPEETTGLPIYDMSEEEFARLAREENPEADGVEISEAYDKAINDAKVLSLTDDKGVEQVNNPDFQPVGEPGAVEFEDVGPESGGSPSLAAMSFEQAQAQFPRLTEQQHKAMVIAAVDAYQIDAKDIPYDDVKQYSESKRKAEDREEYEQAEIARQIEDKGHALPILNMLWRNKINRKSYEKDYGGDLDRTELRGYFTKSGGMTIPQATQRAWGRGWIPEYDENLLIEAIDNELRLRDGIRTRGESALLREGEAEYTAIPDKKDIELNNQAKKYFGTTNDLSEAGYLLKDGSLLDLSGKNKGGPSGSRSLDHREINFAYDEAGLDVDSKYPDMVSRGSNSINLVDFINRGNIRMQEEGIEISRPLTAEQLSVVQSHIMKNRGGWYSVDIQDAKGDVLQNFSYEYPNVKVYRVIADIEKFFSKKKPNIFKSPEAQYQTEMPKELSDLFALQSTPNQRYAQPAWHGSPHDFDQFLLHKIGTGEGAQAYGYGLYFAGDRAVAEYYQKGLSKPRIWVNGKETNITPYQVSGGMDEVLSPLGLKGDKMAEEVLSLWPVVNLNWKELEGKIQDGTLRVSSKKKALNVLKVLSDKVNANQGNLYEVNIPESDNMLDWDKPLSNQNSFIKSVLEKEKIDTNNRVVKFTAGIAPNNDIYKADTGGQIETKYKFNHEIGKNEISGYEITIGNGGTFKTLEEAKKQFSYNLSGANLFYERLINKLGSAENASKYLNSIGIPGIKYLDATSRGKGKGNHNYVIFDDNLIKILNKYSEKPAGHVYQPTDLIIEADMLAPNAMPQAVSDVRQVRPVGQWHDLRLDKAIDRIEADFATKGLTEFVGQKIETIQDVAEIAAVMRHPTIEHLQVIKIKNGKVSGSLSLTSGKVGFIDPGDKTVQDFVADADEFYMSHNHPSGNPTPSGDDMNSAKQMSADKRFKGHVVTDHKTYTAIMPDGTAIAQEFRGEKKSFRSDIEKMDISPAVVGWARRVMQGDRLGIMFVDTQSQVMSFDQVDARSDYSLYIKRHSNKYGAVKVFLVAGESAYAQMSPRKLEGRYVDFLVMNNDGSYASASLGYVKGFSVAYDKRSPEGTFWASRYSESQSDYRPEDYNKVVGRYQPGMKLTLRGRFDTPVVPGGLPRGTELVLVDVDVNTGKMLVQHGESIIEATPNMFKETHREPGAPQPGQKERKFIPHVRGLEKTVPEVKDSIAGNYDVITNETTLAEATAIILEDYNKAFAMAYETKEPDRISNTVAMLLIDRFQAEKNFEGATQLIEHTAERNTKAGQAIQALAMYRRLTPEGILRYADSVVRKAQGAGNFEKLAAELKGLSNEDARVAFAKKHGIPYLSVAKANEIYDFAVKIAGMEEGRARDLETGKMLMKIAELQPKDIWDKINSLQILAQLLNPKTFIRNIIGNAGFLAFENFSQATGVPLDMLISTITGKRTISMPGFITQAKGFYTGLKEGVEESIAGVSLKDINNKFDLPRASAFDSKAMKALEKMLNISLKATDRAFYQAAFNDSLRGQLKIGKLTSPTPEMVAQAHMDGLYRTFNDPNALRTAFSHVKKAFNFGKKWGMGDMVIKYPGTPASLLMRGVEYSPFGFMQAAYILGKAGTKANFNQREFVQTTTRALTGTGMLMGTGMILSALGLIRGRDDDKRRIREIEAAIGVRDYQINLSGLIRYTSSGMDPEVAKMRPGDKLVSYDWMQPAAINLAMGANIERGEGASGMVMIADAIEAASMTLEEQPLLKGVARFFAGRSVTKGALESIKDITASFIPTLLNQVKQWMDNTSRNLNSDSYMAEMVNKVKNKIPFMQGDIPPRVDVLGRVRKMYQNDTNNPFNVFLNPAFVNRYEPTPTSNMVLDIWARTGTSIQIPRIAPRQITVQGVKRRLTEMEQAQFQHYIGEKTSLIFDGLAANPNFMSLPDSEKAKYLQGTLTDIYNSAKVNVLGVVQ